MPDTGAPWNIPYVTSTDLVSDWPADSLALANAIDAGLDAAVVAGIGSNAIVATDTVDRTTTSSSFVDASISVTITPTSASSRVLLIWSFTFNFTRVGGNPLAHFQLTDASDVAVSGAEDWHFVDRSSDSNASVVSTVAFAFVSPSTTSPVTYKGRFKNQALTSVTIANTRSTGQLFAIEVAA